VKALRAVAEKAALAAGRIQQTRPTEVTHKGRVDLVTEIDLACEEAIRALLEPTGLPVLGEEGGGATDVRTRWIVDPLDGTTNFVHGFPSYGCSIGLELDGELALGVIHDPIRDRLYVGERGEGAVCNGQPIHVSTCTALEKALVASGFAYDRREKADDYLRFVKAFLEQAQGFRRAGAAALDLAMVACGQLDGFWEFNLSPWDVAAGALIVQEAGGIVSDMRDGPLVLDGGRILASNGLIHTAMRGVISPLLQSR
jgi:myo-inositol-1(or 4)-monophosphatase